jgi:hypothetical protein
MGRVIRLLRDHLEPWRLPAAGPPPTSVHWRLQR